MRLKESQPNKTAWQVYDHCAALTRLYAVYEQFVIDLVSEFLRLLPTLYDSYHTLPGAIRNQHRVGTGQILLKLGKDGPFKALDENTIIQKLSHGLRGERGYTILEDAFFVDPQNYRADIIGRIFSYLGFTECWQWVTNHPRMTDFLEQNRDESQTPEKELSDFIEYRNEAAHSGVENIIALSEFLIIADFITTLCGVLAEFLQRQVLKRRIEQGQFESIGKVVKTFSNNVIGVQINPCTITSGDDVIIFGKDSCQSAKIESIQDFQTPRTEIQIDAPREIGLKLSRATKKGAEICRAVRTGVSHSDPPQSSNTQTQSDNAEALNTPSPIAEQSG